MAYVKVGKVSEVPAGTSKVYEVNDRAIAVCNVDGAFYAIDDVCTHDEASLEQGYPRRSRDRMRTPWRAIRRQDGRRYRPARRRPNRHLPYSSRW